MAWYVEYHCLLLQTDVGFSSAFAVMFRMSGIGGVAPPPASSAVAQRGSHNRDRDTRRDTRDYNDNYGRRCRGAYCVYEEWYY